MLEQIALFAVDDVLLELLLDRQILVLGLFGLWRSRRSSGKRSDEMRQRIETLSPPVVDQIQRGVPLLSGMRFFGRIFDACTIAPVSPASRSSCRNALLSTTRAAGFRPKLHVRQADHRVALGQLFGDPPRAFDRLQRVAAIFFDAGADRQHERIEHHVFIAQAVSSTARSRMRLAMAIFRSAVRAIALSLSSSIVPATTAAPYFFASCADVRRAFLRRLRGSSS